MWQNGFCGKTVGFHCIVVFYYIKMADGFLGGAAVGAVFGELLKVVIDAGKKMAMFESELQRIESFLVSIKPMVEDIEKSNRLLGRPKEETTMFVDRLRQAKELVIKCSTIHTWNPYKRVKYTKKLIKLEKHLLRFFQMEVQGQLICDSKKILVELRDNSYKLDQMLPILKNGGGFAGLCVVLELRGHIVGLDKRLQELKEMLVQKEGRPKHQNGHVSKGLVANVMVKGAGKKKSGTGLKRGPDPSIHAEPAPPLAKKEKNDTCHFCKKKGHYQKYCHKRKAWFKKKGIFGDIFFATVSKTANFMCIVSKLFEHKGIQPLDEFKMGEDAIRQLEQLMMYLVQENGLVFLVLADVWPGWEFLLQHFRFSIHGYKLLVTSGFMFRRFDCIYKLDILNDEDAMTLFRNPVIYKDGNSNFPDDLVKEIVAGYKGSPLSLTVVVRSVYGQHTVKWRSLLKRSFDGNSIFDSNKDGELYCFQTSLDVWDKSSVVKECFLDVPLFPEDQKIRATTFKDMWVELYNLDDESTLENLLELSFRNLINLVPTRIEALEVEGYCNGCFVAQHDLLRDLAIQLSKEEPTEQRKRLMVETMGNDFPKWWAKQRDQTIHAHPLSISTDRKFSQLPEVEGLILNIRKGSNTLPEVETVSSSSSVTQLSPDTQYPVLEVPIQDTLPNDDTFYSSSYDTQLSEVEAPILDIQPMIYPYIPISKAMLSHQQLMVPIS